MDRSAYARYFELEQRHFWRVARRQLVLELLERHRPGAGPLRLLDVGGSCSLIPREMQRFGEVTVVEPDEPTADFVRRELGLDVRMGRLPDQMPVEGLFDVITLLDVLEHIDDELTSLVALRRLLRPGGRLVVTVPAIPWLWSSHDVALHHRRRYLRDGLRRVLKRSGFQVERVSYHTSLLFPIIAAQRLIDRLKGVGAQAEYKVTMPPAPVNTLFCNVMGVERQLLRRVDLPIGSSLLAICRKRTTSDALQCGTNLANNC